MGKVEDYTLLKCPAGFYCPLGTNAPFPCKVGMYCATTQLSEPTGYCDEGYYCKLEKTDAATLGGIKFCMNNDANKCYIGSKSAKQYVCDAGNYCPTGSFKPKPCSIGTYSSSTGLTKQS